VVPLAGQYFVYFHRICRYFFVAREVQMCEVLLVVCDDRRAWGSLNATPWWEAPLASLPTAHICLLHVQKLCNHLW
jgi:hypothetical protein